MTSAFVANLRSVAQREQNIGHPELAGIIREAADKIEQLQEGRDTMGNLWAKAQEEIKELKAQLNRNAHETSNPT